MPTILLRSSGDHLFIHHGNGPPLSFLSNSSYSLARLARIGVHTYRIVEEATNANPIAGRLAYLQPGSIH
jgi:hypothetical protein